MADTGKNKRFILMDIIIYVYNFLTCTSIGYRVEERNMKDGNANETWLQRGILLLQSEDWKEWYLKDLLRHCPTSKTELWCLTTN